MSDDLEIALEEAVRQCAEDTRDFIEVECGEPMTHTNFSELTRIIGGHMRSMAREME
jgi:hypothetical protein